MPTPRPVTQLVNLAAAQGDAALHHMSQVELIGLEAQGLTDRVERSQAWKTRFGRLIGVPIDQAQRLPRRMGAGELIDYRSLCEGRRILANYRPDVWERCSYGRPAVTYFRYMMTGSRAKWLHPILADRTFIAEYERLADEASTRRTIFEAVAIGSGASYLIPAYGWWIGWFASPSIAAAVTLGTFFMSIMPGTMGLEEAKVAENEANILRAKAEERSRMLREAIQQARHRI